MNVRQARPYPGWRTAGGNYLGRKALDAAVKAPEVLGMAPKALESAATGQSIPQTQDPRLIIEKLLEAADERLEALSLEPGRDHPQQVAYFGSCHDTLGRIERDQRCLEPYDLECFEWNIQVLVEMLDSLAPEGQWFGERGGEYKYRKKVRSHCIVCGEQKPICCTTATNDDGSAEDLRNSGCGAGTGPG